ncbi:MAG: DUF3489 domain-containing protein [Hyphomicrobiaceae bacterium]|nr:DUF3489 domain-containing protein [Hyphomicrobiaceae bacterium]
MIATKSKHTKAQTLIKLISRPNGATVDELMKATSWQRHTVRSVISTEKKKQGLAIGLVDGRYKLANI